MHGHCMASEPHQSALACCSVEGEYEVAFDKTDLVHMDDAMTVPATGGFYKTVAHHFYEVSNTGPAAVC